MGLNIVNRTVSVMTAKPDDPATLAISERAVRVTMILSEMKPGGDSNLFRNVPRVEGRIGSSAWITATAGGTGGVLPLRAIEILPGFTSVRLSNDARKFSATTSGGVTTYGDTVDLNDAERAALAVVAHVTVLER